MTLRHLKIFKTVCEEGSMTGAAKILFITQPSVSQAIAELEDYYGTTLFNRISKKLFITDSGKRLLSYSVKILGLNDEAKTALTGEEKIDKTMLRIGATVTVGETFFASLISQFLFSHVAFDIQSAVYNFKSITEMLLNNQLDLGIAAVAGEEDKRLNMIPYHKDMLVVASSKSHRLFTLDEITIDELIKYRLIVREKGSDVRDLLEKQSVDLNIAGVHNSYHAILESVKHNLGVAIIPRVFVPKEDNSIHTIDIKNPEFQREYFIVTKKGAAVSPHLETFISHCFDYKKYLAF